MASSSTVWSLFSMIRTASISERRPLPLFGQTRIGFQARLRVPDRLEQFLPLAGQPVVHHLSIDDDAADVTVQKLLREQTDSRVLGPLEARRRQVRVVEDHHEDS